MRGMQPPEIDRDVASASTVPSRFYTDPEALELEYARIFARTWQLVGRSADVASAGQYFTEEIAREPLLIARGRDGVLRAMSNVCRHRAGPIASGAGTRPVFQCGYHGWTYSTEGKLLATPEFAGVKNFDRAAVCLPEFKVAEWMGLVFVNLDPAAEPFESVYGDVIRSLEKRDLGACRFAARKNWELDCNWKVYVDNYVEGYHIPIVHPELFRELDYANYRTETRRYDSIQHSPIRSTAKRIRKENEDDEAIYFWIFPNLMLNVYPDNFSTNLILPLGHGRTLTVFDWFFERADDPRLDPTIQFSDEIQLEDIAICESVQRGLASRTYDTGRYSVERENGVHHFHELYAQFMRV
jgi:choline monooxygenase